METTELRPVPAPRNVAYELSTKKLTTFTKVSSDPEVQQKNQDSRARMKVYPYTERTPKVHDLHLGDKALVKYLVHILKDHVMNTY